MTKTIKIKQPTELGIADLLIFGAELFKELAEENDVETSSVTTLKNGKKYKVTLMVELVSNHD